MRKQTDYLRKIIIDLELHSVDGIRECFVNGISPNDTYKDHPLVYELIGEYARTAHFKHCVQLFVEHGLTFPDEALLAILLDDVNLLQEQLVLHPERIQARVTLPCAYTPLTEVSLLHVCAEFNHLQCAVFLLDHGADPNARAGTDEFGFGGQTPIFHTVNQNANHSVDILNLLLTSGADLQITVPGIIWGKDREWETLIPSVNPVSYAMMGLLPQMHRNESTISHIVSLLLRHTYGIEYIPTNVPCAYLAK